MKKYTSLILFLFIFIYIHAQQIPQFSQRMLDKLVFNPAVAGSKMYQDIKFHHRSQWIGFDDAPVTDMLSYNSMIGTSIGIGGYFINDRTGPTKRTSFNLSYAYHIPLEKFYLSMGLSANIMRYSFDGDKITLYENDDAVAMGISDKTWKPDACFGVFLYNSKFFLGLSVLQLFQSKIKLFFNDNTEAVVPLTRHYYLTGGYDFIKERGHNYNIEPSFLLSKTIGSPLQIDFNIRVDYINKIMGGISYRYKDAFVLLTGIRIKKYCFLAYSYDITVSNLRHYNSGSHEIILSVNLPYYKRKNRPKYNLRNGVKQIKRRVVL